MVEVTDEMRRAVAAEQCTRLGHSFDEVVEMGTGNPVRLLCGCCGRSWHVAGAGIAGRVSTTGGGLIDVLVDRDVENYPPPGTRVELIVVDAPDRAENRAGPLDR